MRMLSRTRLVLSLACALGALVALSGCGVPLLGPTPTPTPVTAQGALAAASKAKFKDLSFTINLDMSLQGTDIKGTGNGVATSSPKRFEMNLDLPITVSGISIDSKSHIIEDDATKKTYTQSTVNGTAQGWQVTTTDASSSSDASSLVSAEGIENPVLVGTESVNGIACYHITGTSKGVPVEIWLDKSTFRMEKTTGKVTASGTDMTITFLVTSYDTGAKITLPNV